MPTLASFSSKDFTYILYFATSARIALSLTYFILCREIGNPSTVRGHARQAA